MADGIHNPPLLVTLSEPVGELPAGLVFQLPDWLACALILRRVATPVANLSAYADVTITEEQIEELDLGLDWDVIQRLKA
jgi:hypothetical protein